MSSIYMTVRQKIRGLVLSALGSLSSPRNGIHILNGHMSHRTNPDVRYFEHMMEILSRKVKFVRFEEAVAMIERGDKVNEPIVAFSFDDGFEECETTICPVLERYGINGAFFINPNYVEGDDEYIENFNDNIIFTPGKRPMRWDAIKRLAAKGHVIGAHTMDHYMINDSDLKMLDFQIGTCKPILEEKLGKPCDYFAFPYGRLEHANSNAIDIACKYYKYVFSQSDHQHYHSFNGRVINRRHFEPFWPISHVMYFLNVNKK